MFWEFTDNTLLRQKNAGGTKIVDIIYLARQTQDNNKTTLGFHLEYHVVGWFVDWYEEAICGSREKGVLLIAKLLLLILW